MATKKLDATLPTHTPVVKTSWLLRRAAEYIQKHKSDLGLCIVVEDEAYEYRGVPDMLNAAKEAFCRAHAAISAGLGDSSFVEGWLWHNCPEFRQFVMEQKDVAQMLSRVTENGIDECDLHSMESLMPYMREYRTAWANALADQFEQLGD